MKKILLTGVVISCLAGCTLAPTYTRPGPPVPTSWPSGPAYKAVDQGRAETPASDLDWRNFYTSEQLRTLIDLALRHNRDLRIAALNIERARGFYRIQRADLLPTIGIAATGSEQRLPAGTSGRSESSVVRQYSVNFGFTAFELDLFGRVRSLKDRALENYFASEQIQRSTQIALIGEIANVYLALAADRERLNLAKNTFESQEASYRLIEQRFKVGAASELDLRQAQTRVEAARRDIALFSADVAQDENTLRLLAGADIPPRLLSPELGAPVVLQDVKAGLTSDLLLRRPDILEAEHRLKAANANIGAARAAFFPQITLTTFLGTISPHLSGLFGSGSDTWGFVPAITLPIFDSGRNRAGLSVAWADRDILLAQYEKAIQIGFREVADALALRGTIEDQISAQQSLVDATTKAYDISEARYKSGIDSYLSVLDAQRSLYGAQQILISLHQARLTNLVTLYKVLGGGVP
jgi:outer membrane protein, multidrug efflux system